MRLVLLTAALVFCVDQASKAFVIHGLSLPIRGEIDVLPPFLAFRMAWNEGINFGLFASSHEAMRWVLVAVALAISLWVWLWIRREPHSRTVMVSAGLLIGGALGNVVDRIVYGAVADFLNTSLPGWENPFSFNVADIAIFLGAVGLVAFTGKNEREKVQGSVRKRRADKTP